MGKKVLVISLFIISVFTIKAQRTEKKQIDHNVYGKATVENHYNENDILVQKTTYTTDTIFTKKNTEVGEIILYNDKGILTGKGGYIASNKKNFAGFSSQRSKHGLWTAYYENGTIQGTASFKDNREEGPHTYYHQNGKISQKGNSKKGRIIDTLQTFFNNGQLHKSTLYKKGKIYNILSFLDKNGKSINHGTLKEGEGTLKMYDMKTGMYKKTYTLEEGVFHDIQTKVLKTSKGDVLEKTYKNDDSSTIKIVRQINNVLEGIQEYYENGKLNEIVTYENGIKNGLHKKDNSDGSLFFETNYVNGKKFGPYKFTPEGFKSEFYVLEEGTYNENEEKTGSYKRYLQNKEEVIALGKMDKRRVLILSGTLNDGNKIGLWKTFDDQGELIKEINFSDTKSDLYIHKEYHEDTKTLKSIVEYNNNKKTGSKKIYYPNGQLKMNAQYENEQQDGTYESYYENGQLKAIGQNKEGNKIGVWKEYHENGLIDSNKTYSGEHTFSIKGTDYYYSDDILRSTIYQGDKAQNPLNKNESFYKTTISKDYNKNGTLREYEIKKKVKYKSYGVKHGLYKLNSSTGKKEKEGYYKEDKKDSLWKYYDYNERLESTDFYVNGDRRGPFEEYEYYNNGNLEKHIKGIKHQDSTSQTITYYYENKQIKETGKYIRIYKPQESGRDGLWKEYYENGKLKSEGIYEKGKKKGVWKVSDERGKVIEKIRHK